MVITTCDHLRLLTSATCRQSQPLVGYLNHLRLFTYLSNLRALIVTSYLSHLPAISTTCDHLRPLISATCDHFQPLAPLISATCRLSQPLSTTFQPLVGYLNHLRPLTSATCRLSQPLVTTSRLFQPLAPFSSAIPTTCAFSSAIPITCALYISHFPIIIYISTFIFTSAASLFHQSRLSWPLKVGNTQVHPSSILFSIYLFFYSNKKPHRPL